MPSGRNVKGNAYPSIAIGASLMIKEAAPDAGCPLKTTQPLIVPAGSVFKPETISRFVDEHLVCLVSSYTRPNKQAGKWDGT